MRRFHLLFILGALGLLSCSNDSPVGSEPTLPQTPLPADRSTNQETSQLLSWSGEGGDHFDVYLGTSTNPPLVAHDVTETHYQTALLNVNTLYFWRVVNVGIDSHVRGPVWSFRTRLGVPQAPPVLIAPTDGATVAPDSVLLSWSPEPGDSLTFTVYLGTKTVPTTAAALNIKRNSVSVFVEPDKTYYWRVNARNADGMKGTSPTWHFQTGAADSTDRMFNVAGTGMEGFGEVGQQPLDTQLYWPQDIAFDASGRLIVVDWNNHRVLGTDANNGSFFLLAGSTDGKQGEPCSFYPVPCDEIGAAESPLNHPTSVLFRPDGNMVLSAWHNSSVFLVDVAGQTMSRIAGTGKLSYDEEGKAANASGIALPSAAVYDINGDLIFTDQSNMILRRIDSAGVIHRFAGVAPVFNGLRYVGQTGFSGDEGPALDAKFKWDPTVTCGKLCTDAAGNIYVADTSNHAVRRIDTSGIIHRFAGLFPASPGFSGDGGPATSAKLTQPRDVACDSQGNVFICDSGNHAIRMVNSQGIISTVAGVPGEQDLDHGSDNGKLATQTKLNQPYGIEIDSHGNLWIADTDNSRIRVVYR